MPPATARERLIVFAKPPVAGAVKTRLVPRLGAQGAADLHAKLVEHTMSTAQAVGGVELELHAYGGSDAFLRACADTHDAAIVEQCGRDLGERMHHAFTRALEIDRCDRAVLIGSDCPALTAGHLSLAFEALRAGCDAVLSPAEDGGYVLIGLTRVAPELFSDIPWSTEVVMAQTRERLLRPGWSWRELETLWDVDRPADYDRLAASGVLA